MSFSAEMKDFLNAYKAGQSINASRTDQEYKGAQTEAVKLKTERDNDPETLKLATDQARATLALTQDRMKNNAAARGATAASTALRQEQLRQLKQGTVGGSGLYPTGAINPTITPGGTAVPAQAPVPAASGVLPVAPPTIDTSEDLYADGGLVDDGDDEELEAAAAEPVGAVNTAPAQAPITDMSAQSRRNPNAVPRGMEGIISPQLVEDARKAGMTFGIDKAGLNQSGAVRSPAAMLKAKQIAQGMGGLTEQEMQAARQAVDPEGKLTDSQRNLAALGSVYQFWANKGEPERARRVAFQMLQYYRGAAQRYAAIAAKAAEGGNMDLATKAALKAYQNVPDGKDLEIMPNPDGGLMYTYTDAKGDVIAKGIATPQQLAASAMGLATGGFDKALMAAAGAASDTGAVKTSGSGRPQTASDRAKEAESVGGEVEKLKTAWQAKNKDKPVDEEQWSEVGNIAQHIYQQNPKATANEVARAAHAMLSMGDDPEKPGFKVKPGEDGKPNTVDFGGRLKIELDDGQLESILNARAVRVKAAVDEINKKMEEGDKPGFIEKITPAVGAIGDVLAKDGKKFAGEVAAAVPEEMKARAGSAVQAGGRAVNDALRTLTNPDINFGTMSTAFKDNVRSAAQAVLDKLGAVKGQPSEGAIPGLE